MDHGIYSDQQKKLRALLKRARVSQRITQKSLALTIGEHQTFISKYERGERVLNSTEWIEILQALNSQPEDIVVVLSDMIRSANNPETGLS